MNYQSRAKTHLKGVDNTPEDDDSVLACLNYIEMYSQNKVQIINSRITLI